MSQASLTLVVPAYNEEAALPRVVPELLRACEAHDWQLIIVDDGSTDGTGEQLARFADTARLTVLRHKVNRGYGGALKSGIAAVTTDYLATMDADGQHPPSAVASLFDELRRHDADLMVGDRSGARGAGWYRGLGRLLIRLVARLLLELPVRDLNSGLKVYNASLAKQYARLCPDSMAFSDVMTLVFVSQKHRVLERPIELRPRLDGQSTISTRTALETVIEILNIVVLFNPMRIFLPMAVVSLVTGVAWGLPIVLDGRGVSVGAMLAILAGVITFFLGLIAEQIALLRRRP